MAEAWTILEETREKPRTSAAAVKKLNLPGMPETSVFVPFGFKDMEFTYLIPFTGRDELSHTEASAGFFSP
ncbi:hypothetical protein AGMMS49546_33490 [Spirochaetia bacterium]|nr:hypothetical protein AGMMS49546_33490 [Spirochaetia bacterium]